MDNVLRQAEEVQRHDDGTEWNGGKPAADAASEEQTGPAEIGTGDRKSERPLWAAITLRVLKALIIPLLCLAALFIGLAVGYVYLGGRPVDDIWQWTTWKHVFDLVFSGV